MTTTKSIHILAEFWECDGSILDDEVSLREHMTRAAEEAGATPLNTYSRRFEPTGVTVIVAVAESHLSIHTWPGQGYAALDVFTCGDTCQPKKAIEYLRGVLLPLFMNMATINRGNKGGFGVHVYESA